MTEAEIRECLKSCIPLQTIFRVTLKEPLHFPAEPFREAQHPAHTFDKFYATFEGYRDGNEVSLKYGAGYLMPRVDLLESIRIIPNHEIDTLISLTENILCVDLQPKRNEVIEQLLILLNLLNKMVKG